MPVDSGLSHTDWGMIHDAAGVDRAAAAEAMHRLVRRYWPAVYAFIRRSGRDVHEAADLTQGFICDVILGRRLVHHADPRRGRFRALLLTAVQNYVRQHHRDQDRAAPASVAGLARGALAGINLGDADRIVTDYRGDDSPEKAFVSQWGATLVRQVLDSVRIACLKDSMEAHWTIFEHRVARPMLLGEEPTGYPQLVQRLGLPGAEQAANMLVTVKRRFARALLREIGHTVNGPAEVETELHDLLRSLERGS